MEAELLMIATNHQANSRLACQVKLNPKLEVFSSTSHPASLMREFIANISYRADPAVPNLSSPRRKRTRRLGALASKLSRATRTQ
jgi:hypothetical protein